MTGKRTQAKRAALEGEPPRETIDIRTADGWSLRADVHEPSDRRDGRAGVAVLAHGSLSRRRSFDGPSGNGIVRLLVEQGWRVVAFDFRGHGDSEPPARGKASYSYDDFVTSDLPAVHAFARSRSRRNRPVVLIGHSLGGHVALAAQGAGLVAFDGVGAIASNVWLRVLEPLPARWLLKRASLAGALAVSRRIGRFPARTLGLGSDDASSGYVEDLARYARTNEWTSADGRMDYFELLGSVRVPTFQVVSDGDLLACVPECGERFIARCGGPRETIRVTHDDFGGREAPDHAGLLTSEQARSVWRRIEGWMRRIPVQF